MQMSEVDESVAGSVKETLVEGDLEPYSEPEYEGADIAYDVSGSEKAQDETREQSAVKQLIANQLEAVSEEQPSIFANFVHDSMAQTMQTYAIRHKKQEDTVGRIFYEFDDGCANPLVIICFDTPIARLISVNKVVMPIKTFLSIIKMEETTTPKEEVKATGDLRSPPLILHTHIRCSTESGDLFHIPNTKVEQLIMALSVLGKDEGSVDDPEILIPTPPTLFHLPVETTTYGPLRRFLQWLW